MKSIRLATVFSGIGAIEFALKRLSLKHEVVFACDNGEREIEYDLEEEKSKLRLLATPEEKAKYMENLYSSQKHKRMPNYVQTSYLNNYKHHMPRETFFQDIRLMDGKDFQGQVDLFMGGSPCQSFSTVGKQFGLEDTRGTLFYDFARMVRDIQPKIFIYENVRGMTTHDKTNTFSGVMQVMRSLGYHVSFNVFNATEFNIPQNRRRLLIVGTKEDIGFDVNNIKRPGHCDRKMQEFLEDNCAEGHFKSDGKGNLIIENVKGKPSEKAILTPAVTRYVLSGGTKNFYTKPVTDLPIARTLLKTMVNHHRAGVDNYITIDKDKQIYRALTPRECLRLMGFTDDFDMGDLPWSKLYMQAGNSIVVDMLISVVKGLIECKAFE